MNEKLSICDSEIDNLIKEELDRQKNTIELIASENFTSKAVMEAMGSILTNKYSEGYPSKRYYGGCEVVDKIETLAINRAKELFGAEHANVQAHSGSQANMAVYMSVLNPKDVILGMDLSAGGHLTHGSKVNFSGRLFDFQSYGVNSDGLIDYDNVLKIALECRPKMIVAGASAYSRLLDFKKFREIADEVGAYLMVDMAHIAGLVAAKLHESPVDYADFVTSTTHKTLRGPRGGLILCKKEFATKIDKTIFPGIQGGPLEHIIAGKAVCFKEALDPSFKEYIKNVLDNTKILAEELKNLDFKIVSNGTDNHLFLVDLTNKGVTGKEAETILENIGITVNKNSIPNELLSPFITSGIRLGTAAITTRGFRQEDMKVIAAIINEALKKDIKKDELIYRVKNLCDKYPLY